MRHATSCEVTSTIRPPSDTLNAVTDTAQNEPVNGPDSEPERPWLTRGVRGHRHREPARRHRTRDPHSAAAKPAHLDPRRTGRRARPHRGRLRRAGRRSPASSAAPSPTTRTCRRTVAVGGYTTTAVLASLTAAATSVWQVGVLRAGAWTARGLRVPVPQRPARRRRPPQRLRAGLRLRAHDGQPRRHLRPAARARPRRRCRHPMGHRPVRHPRPARRRRDRLRDPSHTTSRAPRPRAPAHPGPTCPSGQLGPAHGGCHCIRGRQHRRDPADPARDRAARPRAAASTATTIALVLYIATTSPPPSRRCPPAVSPTESATPAQCASSPLASPCSPPPTRASP